MQTLFEAGFVLAMILPAAAVALSAGAVLATSLVHRRPHRTEVGVDASGAAALHHPAGR
jgi:hypothetical protein